MIKFFGLDRQYQNLREEILSVTDMVYTTGQVLDGPFTQAFETRMARLCARKYAVAVNSGTQALIFAQMILNLREQKIMIPGISFVATLNSVLMAGNAPVFCDVDNAGLLDINSVEYALNGQIDAVMYVNLYGNCIDYNKLHTAAKFFNDDVFLIEDAAQSFGAKYQGRPSGSFGDVSVLSFDPTKNLANYGSGGMVLMDDYDLYKYCVDLRDNGKMHDHDYYGTNSKMSESDCAQMTVKLKYFDAWQTRRKAIAKYYDTALYPFVDLMPVATDVDHSYHKYVIRTMERSALQGHLLSVGIESKIHYSKTLSEHTVGWEYVNYSEDILRESTALTKDCLSLPIYPELTDSEVEQVAEAVTSYIN